jgi:hypothetical protein
MEVILQRIGQGLRKQCTLMSKYLTACIIHPSIHIPSMPWLFAGMQLLCYPGFDGPRSVLLPSQQHFYFVHDY